MTRQWKRVGRLSVSNGGSSIDLSNMRFEFEIRDVTTQTPRSAIITIYNLSEATAQKLPTNGGKITLEAGYEDGYARIFSGDVKERHLGRASPTETYATIYADDGMKAYTGALVSKTLKAGSTGQDVYQAVLEAMKPFGISQGHIPAILAQQKDPRSQALFGMGRDILRKLALATQSNWKIADGKLNVVPVKESLPGGAVVLNSMSGLIGRATQTDEGIIGRALLNPRSVVHGQVQIDEKSIDRAPYQFSYPGQPQNEAPFKGTINTADGTYKVIKVDHIGDSRGNPWYTDFVCDANGAITSSSIQQGRTQGPI